MNKRKFSYFQPNMKHFDTALYCVSKITGYGIALGAAWMFFNGNPDAVNAVPIADVFMKASQTRTVATKDEDSLVKPKDK